MGQKHGYNPKDQMEAHTGRDTWIHLDSLESVEKSDESRDDDDIVSWVDLTGDVDSREFEEPEMYETKSYRADGQRLDCGRQNNSK